MQKATDRKSLSDASKRLCVTLTSADCVLWLQEPHWNYGGTGNLSLSVVSYVVLNDEIQSFLAKATWVVPHGTCYPCG